MKFTLKSWLVIGLMAWTFLIVVKWAAAKSKVAGLQAAAAAG